MLKEQRLDQILSILENEKYTTAQKLSRLLFVSLPTIRRDLAELDRQGRIVRSHGGAKAIEPGHIVAPLDFRKTVHSTQKRRLCQAAADLIGDNEIVFIDSSTTTLQIADFLGEKKNITAITNGIPLATLLMQKGIKTYCTGGEIFQNSLAHFGSFAEEFIQRFNIDTLLFSCHGVTEKGMLTDPSLPETQIRKVAINQSKKTVFLCDESKFSLSAPYNLAPLSAMDYIITDCAKASRFIEPDAPTKIILVPIKTAE